MKPFNLTVKMSANAARVMSVSMAEQDIRYYLCGILVDLEKGCLVATNGHMMSRWVLDPNIHESVQYDFGKSNPGSVIVGFVTDKLLKEFKSKAKQRKVFSVELTLVGDDAKSMVGSAVFKDESTSIIASVPIVSLGGRYPDYASVLPAADLAFSHPPNNQFVQFNPDYVSRVAVALDISTRGEMVSTSLKTQGDPNKSILVAHHRGGLPIPQLTHVVMPVRG